MGTKKKMGQVYTMVGGPANAKGMDGEAWVRGVPREVAKEYEKTFGDHPSFVKNSHSEARAQWNKLSAAKTAKAFVRHCSEFAGTLLKKMQEQREAFHKNRKAVAAGDASMGAGAVNLEAMKMGIPGYEPKVPAEPGPEPEPEPEEEGDKDQDPAPGIDADAPPEEEDTPGGGGNAG